MLPICISLLAKGKCYGPLQPIGETVQGMRHPSAGVEHFAEMASHTSHRRVNWLAGAVDFAARQVIVKWNIESSFSFKRQQQHRHATC